jgi:hypothetical protein
MLCVCVLHSIVECFFSLEKEETASDTKVPLEHGDSEDYPYDDEEHTDNQGKKLKITVFYILLHNNKTTLNSDAVHMI